MKVSKPVHRCDDGNSPMCQSVPNVQPEVAAIPTPLESVQQKRKPGSGHPKGRKSTVAPEDRPCRLGRPPGTGHLQRANALANGPEKRPPKPVVPGNSRPFNLVRI